MASHVNGGMIDIHTCPHWATTKNCRTNPAAALDRNPAVHAQSHLRALLSGWIRRWCKRGHSRLRHDGCWSSSSRSMVVLPCSVCLGWMTPRAGRVHLWAARFRGVVPASASASGGQAEFDQPAMTPTVRWGAWASRPWGLEDHQSRCGGTGAYQATYGRIAMKARAFSFGASCWPIMNGGEPLRFGGPDTDSGRHHGIGTNPAPPVLSLRHASGYRQHRRPVRSM
jgi:hypothetical protein